MLFRSVGSFPEGVVAADFNGDQKTDIATSSNFEDKVSVLLGVGDGTLMPAVNFDVGAGPFGLAAADLNRDGRQDITSANIDEGTATVLLNETEPPAFECVGDCNGDGQVTVNELIVMVNIALGNAPLSQCTAGDANTDGEITINEIIAAVNNTLSGCPQ